ncbi:glycerate kinase [Paenibacillus abyssi]|uniref:glycerate kinase n=1 Tax=Paenibacillus abyssi TaxID=1340531 RepID=UPI001663C785
MNNPLHGPRGAAYIFGPQKGATPEILAEFDQGLRSFLPKWYCRSWTGYSAN